MDLPLYKIEISGIIIIVRCASVAQSVEQGTENPRVIGSIPIGGTSQETQQGFQYAAVAHLVERHLAKVEVASSSLVARSKKEVTTYVVTSFLDSGRKLKCSGEVNSPSAKFLLRKTLVRRKSADFLTPAGRGSNRA